MADEYTLSYTAEQIDERLGKAGQAVLFTSQRLTEEQKAQAKQNLSITDGTFFVTATALSNDAGGTLCTADKTMAQIMAAYNAKQSVLLRFPQEALTGNLEGSHYLLIPMVYCTSSAIGFTLYAGGEAIGKYGNAVFDALMEDDESFYVTRTEAGGSGTGGVYILAEGEDISNAPESAVLVIDPGDTIAVGGVALPDAKEAGF